MNRIDAIKQKIAYLRELLTHLDKTIVDKDAKEFLLHTPKSSLGDVETTYLLPQALQSSNADIWFRAVDFQLQWAERDLKHAQDAVAKYGATLRVVG